MKIAASQGAAPPIPFASIRCTETGVRIIPPKDNPVEAMDNAMERRRANQRATRVVPGMRAVAA
jgi:hypothetical protein